MGVRPLISSRPTPRNACAILLLLAHACPDPRDCSRRRRLPRFAGGWSSSATETAAPATPGTPSERKKMGRRLRAIGPTNCATTNAPGGNRAPPNNRPTGQGEGGGALRDQFLARVGVQRMKVKGQDDRKPTPIAAPDNNLVRSAKRACSRLPSLHFDCLVFQSVRRFVDRARQRLPGVDVSPNRHAIGPWQPRLRELQRHRLQASGS